VILREFSNQNVIGVSDSAALVLDDIIFAANRCSNQALGWKSWVHDGVSCVPILARVCDVAVFGAKLDDCGWQIVDRMNFVEPR